MDCWYRTESYSGSGVRDAIDVISFEITELGNFEILEDLSRYAVQNTTASALGSISAIADPSMLYDENGSLQVSEVSIRNIIKLILATIGIFRNKDIRYALWLVNSRALVRNLYGGTYDNIDCYDVSDAVLLVDLGKDGSLFGFQDMPKPLESDSIDSLKSKFKLLKEE